MKNIDVIIMVSESHLHMLKRILPYCKNNVNPKRIYVIANQNIKKQIIEIPDIEFVDENTVYNGLNYNSVQAIIEDITGQKKRAGWYLQQFLKMAWSFKCEDTSYISVDADTFLLNPIEFFDNSGKYLITPKIEYHKPYFDCIDRLFEGRIHKVGDFSFIAENMIFDSGIMKNMILEIENNSNLKGEKFYEKILYAVNPGDILFSGFSEFETYGTFIFTNYPERVKLRPLRTMREALVLLGSNPSEAQLKWASEDYDIISIEASHYKKTLTTWLTSKSLFRKKVSMKKLAKMRYRIRRLYRRILKKEDFYIEQYN